MAIRQIVKDNMEFLNKKSKKVEVIDQKIIQLVEDMKETLRKSGGVGLAAPQVGMLKRIFVVDVGEDGNENHMVFINPEIVKTKGKNDKYYEGCLSFPGRSFKVIRPHKVTMRAQNIDGEVFEMQAEDFIARALMHEYDHLEGVVIPMIGKEVFD